MKRQKMVAPESDGHNAHTRRPNHAEPSTEKRYVGRPAGLAHTPDPPGPAGQVADAAADLDAVALEERRPYGRLVDAVGHADRGELGQAVALLGEQVEAELGQAVVQQAAAGRVPGVHRGEGLVEHD